MARISLAAAFLALSAIIALGGSIYLFLRGEPIIGFILAGVSGCGVSIVTKLPPLSVYGEASSLVTRILGRLAAGVVASAAGLGVLASGMLKIELGETPMSQLLRGCTDSACQAGTSGCCPRSAMLVLLTLGVIFGFSERALTSIEQTVFGKAEKEPQQRPSAAPAGS